MVYKKKFFRRSSVKYQTFSEGPTWSDLFRLLEKMKIRHKLSKNFSIHDKNCEISAQYNFWTSAKSNNPDVWNWHFGPWLIQKLKCRECPSWLFSGYTPVNSSAILSILCNQQNHELQRLHYKHVQKWLDQIPKNSYFIWNIL